MLKVLFIAMLLCFTGASTIARSATAPTTKPTSKINAYPEVITKHLLDVCEQREPSIQLFLALDRKAGKPVRVLVDQKIRQINDQAKNSEGQVEQQVQQRQAELTELIQDKNKFKEQIQQLKDAINSKQIPSAQLPQIQQLLDDLLTIQSDPRKLSQLATESRQKLLLEIRNQ